VVFTEGERAVGGVMKYDSLSGVPEGSRLLHVLPRDHSPDPRELSTFCRVIAFRNSVKTRESYEDC
jgi:hypothetical protein